MFRARFRRHALGWRSQPAIKRIKEAISEIRTVARRDPVLAGEGAVLFLERLSPALERIDSSSGAIGTATCNAVEALVPILVQAPTDEERRDQWLDRLWEAFQDDGFGYIQTLADHWGELCVTPERASLWADRLIDVVRLAWSPDPAFGGFFPGTIPCLSALFKAGRYEEVLRLLEMAPYKMWHYRKWAVRALAAQGRAEAALRYAEVFRGPNDPDSSISRTCEAILLDMGRSEDAYDLYAHEANRRGTYLATFRAIVRKYPERSPAEILSDLVSDTPGQEGKWFAAARSFGLYEEAIELARRSPCDPKTLTRAARDEAESHPRFAVEAGLTALAWLLQGYGYEIQPLDAVAAFDFTMAAAENAGIKEETLMRVQTLLRGRNSVHASLLRVLEDAVSRR